MRKLIPAKKVQIAFVKRTGQYVYLRLSEGAVKRLKLKEHKVYGVSFNGNVCELTPETEVYEATLRDMVKNQQRSDAWARVVGCRDEEEEEKPDVPAERVTPDQGGCWYCHTLINRPAFFSVEFDTYMHQDCFEERLLREDKLSRTAGLLLRNQELAIFAREFAARVVDGRVIYEVPQQPVESRKSCAPPCALPNFSLDVGMQ